jgi:hypothetical protein
MSAAYYPFQVSTAVFTISYGITDRYLRDFRFPHILPRGLLLSSSRMTLPKVNAKYTNQDSFDVCTRSEMM